MTDVRRVFYDTEFIDDGHTIRMISIGMVTDDGESYYAIVDDDDVMRDGVLHPWLRGNVMIHLPGRLETRHGWNGWEWQWDRSHKDFGNVKPRAQIAADVATFLLEPGVPVELWAWFAAYDHVALAQLFGPMSGLPAGIPMFTHELRQRWEESGRPDLPVQHSAHHALTDAYWDRALWMRCESMRLAPPMLRRSRPW